jgi:15-cis-phytoene synthase
MTPPQSAVETIARKSGSNFYLSFLSLPKEKREAISAVYAFCRAVDDAVDEPGDADPTALLTEWRAEIARTFDGHPTQPLTQALADAIDRFNLTRTYFNGIIQGCEMDISQSRYPTFEALYPYMYHVAGEVGLLCMEIFGYRSERMRDYAVKLGVAFQLTNILRDVGGDALRGRIYLPQEDLRRFGVDENWLLAASERRSLGTGPEAQAFRRLMAFETTRARGTYRDAAVLPHSNERSAISAAEIMRAIYADILERIERNHFDVLSERIRVPAPMKIWLAAKAWWGCR